jgi:hypothetical protein
MFTHNDILLLKKYKPFDLMRISVFDGVKLSKSTYFAPDNVRRLFINIMKKEKFKNVKIDESIIDLIIHTDNSVAERKLFYPAFFLDNDFDLGRFVMKGVMVFECHNIERTKDGVNSLVELEINDGIANDVRIDFSIIEEDFYINIVKVHEINSVKINSRFDCMKSEIIATVTAHDTGIHITKKGKLRYISNYWLGTCIDHPDFDCEISWL